jgi:hypothetical protein
MRYDKGELDTPTEGSGKHGTKEHFGIIGKVQDRGRKVTTG